MPARHNLRRTLDRVDGLIALNKRLSTQGRPPRENTDILRAAVVLSLGALDAAVADAIVEAVPEASKQKKLGKRVADWLEKDGAECLNMLAHANPHKALADFVSEKLAITTFQRTGMIQDNLQQILDVPPPWAAAAKRAGGNLTADELKEHLNHFSDRRNQIAHKGDVKSGQRAAETLTRDWVERHVGYVRATGEAICDAIARMYGPKKGRPRKK